jgi:hypothetical protein
MPLTRWERKARLKHGDGKRTAKRTGRPESHVSETLSGVRRDPVIEKELARRMRPITTPEEAFGPQPMKAADSVSTAA